MKTLAIHLREKCCIEAFQMWLDSKEPGHKIVSVKAEAPCKLVIDVEVKEADGENI